MSIPFGWHPVEVALKTFVSFDGTTIAYRDEGGGSPVILLHGYGVDALGQFGSFERILPILEARQTLFNETFGGAPPLPDPPAEGRPGIIPPLLSANARVILPDLRGFGASSKSREVDFYSNWAMARDVIALIEHLHLDAVDLVGFSMGAGTAARVVILGPPQVKSAILAGIGDYAIEGTVLEFPKNWPVPEHLPKPLTHKIWAEEGARVLEKNELVPGNLGSAHVIAARVTGAGERSILEDICGIRLHLNILLLRCCQLCTEIGRNHEKNGSICLINAVRCCEQASPSIQLASHNI